MDNSPKAVIQADCLQGTENAMALDMQAITREIGVSAELGALVRDT
jgi:hypothetical protein